MSDPNSRRAIRRHHRARVVTKARRITRGWADIFQSFLRSRENRDYTLADQQAVRIADNLKVCSLPRCCGNRRHSGYEDPRTISEIRADEAFQEALQELFFEDPLDLVDDPS